MLGAAGVTSPGRQCDHPTAGYLCGPGSVCQAVGTCSLSGADCSPIGQPCGPNQGICTTVTNTCLALPEADVCAPAAYSRPAAPIGVLPGAESTLLPSLANRFPSGGTPMGPAVEGALAYLRMHGAAHPGRKLAMIIATDGTPSECAPGNTIPAIADLLAAARRATPAITTYVVGIFAPYETADAGPQLDRLATAGGTNRAFILTATQDLPMTLQASLATIRGSALACEFKIPTPKAGAVDFRKVNVRYTAGGSRSDLLYVGRAEQCDPARGGWYYDVDPAQGRPTLIRACEASCRQFQADANGRVDLGFGCATHVVE